MTGESVRLVDVALGSPEHAASFSLRARVLLDPFGIDHELAREDDARARHLALFDGAECVAVLMLVPLDSRTMRMRQVAVAPDRQRSGLGSRLTREAEKLCKETGVTRIVAHARAPALPFYESLAYRVTGEPFVEVGIAHRTVEKKL